MQILSINNLEYIWGRIGGALGTHWGCTRVNWGCIGDTLGIDWGRIGVHQGQIADRLETQKGH